MNLLPPSEHQVLVFLCAVGVLLLAARGLGWLMGKIGQPAVVGELTAGLLLGPSVLGWLAPGAFDWLFPPDEAQTAMLFTVGWLGVIFLLLATGFETDLALIRRLGRAAAVVSAGSLVVPMVLGLGLGFVLPDLFLASTDDRTVFALFMATALSISSLPVIAKILGEMGFMRRNFGQLTLAAGMANDVVGWIALGIIAGLASGDQIELSGVAMSLLGVLGFFVVAMTLGQRLVDVGLRNLRRSDADATTRTAVIVLVTLAGAVATQWLGVEAVLGAFVIGVLLGRSPYRAHDILAPVETITASFLAPIFFATAGLRVDLGLLGDPAVLGWGLAVIAVASISKFLGTAIGGALVRMPGRESSALGIALNARGALEIVIATVGLSLGVLNQASYTVVVLMAMATSMMAPPLLRAVLSNWHGTAEEQDRLRQEEALDANVVVKTDRLLVPTRGGLFSLIAGQIADLAWPVDTPVTLLTLGSTDSQDVQPIRNVLAERELTERRLEVEDPVAALVEEAKLGYGAVVLGLADRPGEDRVLSTTAERVLAEVRIPVVMVRRGRTLDRPLPWAYGRALVPVAGTRTARSAQEVAYGISAKLGTEIVLAHVVSREAVEDAAAPPAPTTSEEAVEDVERIGRGVLWDAGVHALSSGARIQTLVHRAATPAKGVLALTEQVAADLVVVGATVRSVAGRPFLGHTVEEILAACPATVVVVVAPPEQ
jgi:Kef-type K+ transport system membrane component KefB